MREFDLLEKASHKRVLFVGETIEDVYHYVRPLGRPLKESIVSVELMSSETFEGGVLAAKRHAEQFCMHVDCYSEGPVIRKERFVEASHIRKLFECYVNGRHSELEPPYLKQYDCVIVTDYGHGMMTERRIEEICFESRYLAVNVQTNSGNYGFNLATKYPGADYLCVDEPEARLATQNRSGPIEDSAKRLGEIAPKVVITMGKEGALGYYHDEIWRAPAFTDKIVDTLGAGDAFFAVTAPIAEEADMESLLRIGNAAGALKAGIVGHRKSITKAELVELLARSG